MGAARRVSARLRTPHPTAPESARPPRRRGQGWCWAT